jgi:YVTN family beta-propeller protein
VATTPNGSAVYVANSGSTTVSVINTGTNTVTATISGLIPAGIDQLLKIQVLSPPARSLAAGYACLWAFGLRSVVAKTS